MNALVVGSGGREHALADALHASGRLGRVFVAPGNGGTKDNVPIPETDIASLAEFAEENDCFTVVGPEGPLSEGIVDAFAKKSLPIFGPTRAAARLESSKSWAKDFMVRHKIPTAEYGVFDGKAKALDFASKFDYKAVVKADGLAAGKGVIVCDTQGQVQSAIRSILDGRFGQAGAKIIVERRIDGQEASFIAMCDGSIHVALATSQDHKRAHDGDTGPNTGGMGAYSPALLVDENAQKTLDAIMEKTVDGMRREGAPFTGFLYAGVIFEKGIPYVLEFNARMGDPECQAILPRMDSDIFEYMDACTGGRLAEMDAPVWKKQCCACVVLASRGYPGEYQTGQAISGIESASQSANVYHAGTKKSGNRTITCGGRVLGVSALGESVADAASAAYDACEKISWPGKYCRTDIGKKAL